MLAVQESNFLLSFTLSAFSAMGTSFTILQEGDYQGFDSTMITVSLVYGVYGTVVAVLVYGRKVVPNWIPYL